MHWDAVGIYSHDIDLSLLQTHLCSSDKMKLNIDNTKF